VDHLVYEKGKKALNEGYFLDPNYNKHPDPPGVNVLVRNGYPPFPWVTDICPPKGSVIFAHPCQQQNRKIIVFKENNHKNSPS
jgi:hypothetical protein